MGGFWRGQGRQTIASKAEGDDGEEELEGAQGENEVDHFVGRGGIVRVVERFAVRLREEYLGR